MESPPIGTLGRIASPFGTCNGQKYAMQKRRFYAYESRLKPGDGAACRVGQIDAKPRQFQRILRHLALTARPAQRMVKPVMRDGVRADQQLEAE